MDFLWHSNVRLISFVSSIFRSRKSYKTGIQMQNGLNNIFSSSTFLHKRGKHTIEVHSYVRWDEVQLNPAPVGNHNLHFSIKMKDASNFILSEPYRMYKGPTGDKYWLTRCSWIWNLYECINNCQLIDLTAQVGSHQYSFMQNTYFSKNSHWNRN